MLHCLSQITRSMWEPWSRMLGCALFLLWMPGGRCSRPPAWEPWGKDRPPPLAASQSPTLPFLPLQQGPSPAVTWPSTPRLSSWEEISPLLVPSGETTAQFQRTAESGLFGNWATNNFKDRRTASAMEWKFPTSPSAPSRNL